MIEVLQTVLLTIVSYGIAIIFACLIGWTIAKIFRDGPFLLQIIVGLMLFGLLVIGPIIGIWQGTQERNPIYYDEAPSVEFDRYS